MLPRSTIPVSRLGCPLFMHALAIVECQLEDGGGGGGKGIILGTSILV